MVETQAIERSKTRKTIEETLGETIINAGYEIMMGRREKAAELLTQARDALKNMRSGELTARYNLYHERYVNRWGPLE